MSAQRLKDPILKGRTAVVTGAGAGVGRGIAEALGDAGAQVTVAVRRKETGDETVALIEQAGGVAMSVQCDVAQRGDVERMVDATIERFGRLDIVVHNAASGLGGKPAKLEDITDEMWTEQCGVGLNAAFFLARAAYPHLKASAAGRFILLSSSQGLHGGAMNPAYPGVKNAQRGFMKALAREWGPDEILVNAIAPAALTGPAAAYFERNPEMRAMTEASFALGRLGDSRDDIGAAIAAMCSDYFRYVSGQLIVVDGGNYTAL